MPQLIIVMMVSYTNSTLPYVATNVGYPPHACIYLNSVPTGIIKLAIAMRCVVVPLLFFWLVYLASHIPAHTIHGCTVGSISLN